MFPRLYWGTYCVCPVCWFVRWFVCLRQTFTFTITYAILKIATWYLACMCISWSCTFWAMKGQGHPSRSKVKKYNPREVISFKWEIIYKPAKWYIEILFQSCAIVGIVFRCFWQTQFLSNDAIASEVTSRCYSVVLKLLNGIITLPQSHQ